MGTSSKETKCVLDGALLDTRANVLASVGLSLLPAVCVANMKNVEPKMDDSQKLLKEIGKSLSTVGTILFYFHFGRQEYSVKMNIVPGHTPLRISHKDLDDIGLSYQRLSKSNRMATK